MIKRLSMILVVLLFIQPAWVQVIFDEPLSLRNANYKMDVTLDVEKKQILGHEILTWRNISSNGTGELQFHLYMNAFKNDQSTFFRERGNRGGTLAKKKAWGWIDVDTIRVVNGMDLSDRMEFIHPDDDNEDDRTVMRVLLPDPVRPGEEVRIEIDFITQLPWVYDRNGYYKDFFFAAQWFPKVGVYTDGAWNCHQYHSNSEFFADYGVYEVSITLPKEYVVGATGLLQNTTETNTNKTLAFRAEDVHDFAWTAWPHFKTAKETHRGVEIKILYDEDHSSSVPRYTEAMKHTLNFFAEWIGEYPYPNVTVVDPPTGCWSVGGMEYPTFIAADTFWKLPEGILVPESVTAHEFGHNFWYGIVGNNEFEEAWLDEGINSYAEVRIMDKYYGKETSSLDILGIRVGELAYQRIQYIGLARWDRTLRNAWTYIGGGYGTLSYAKPTLMLWTLENLVGQETMDRIMKTFFQRWKFKHPRSQDFIDTVNEVTGENFDWYFDQVLKGSNELDYRIYSVMSTREREPRGVFDQGNKKVTLPDSEKKEDTNDTATDTTQQEPEELFRSVVKVHRKGEVIVPVDVLMVFDNGDSIRQVWDGRDRWVKYEFLKPVKLVSAIVDPDRKLVLDSNFSNNSRTVKHRKNPVNYLSSRFLYWFESVLHIIGFFG